MRSVFWRLVVLLVLWTASREVSARSLEFQTSQATAADLALSPDGKTLLFTILGHLFSLTPNGGTAEQLTFGPYYDHEPVFSPNGAEVAFTSDRDRSDGNIYMLGVATHQLVQLTHEEHAGRPTWSPDGKFVVYLRYEHASSGRSAVVSRISAQGGQPELLTAPPKRIGSEFYLPDGRLAWSVIERESESGNYVTRIEILTPQGTASTLRTIRGLVDRVLSNSAGNALYCHRILGDKWIPISEDIVFIPLATGAENAIVPVSSLQQFALSTDGKSLYLSDEGQLRRVSLPAGASESLPFHAQVKLQIPDITSPLRPVINKDEKPRAIVSPRLSPDGRMLVFGAAGYLWRQPLSNGKAKRVTQSAALESEPAFSPDGRQLAFVQTEHGVDSVILLDLPAGQTRVLTSGPSISELSWSSDGQRLVGVVALGFDQHIAAFNLSDGKSEQLRDTSSWSPRPQLSAESHTLYYSTDTTGIGNFFKLALSKDANPEQITHLSQHLSDARISTDGKWLAFRRNHSIWVAELGSKPVEDSDVHQLSPEGGDTFALTPEGSSAIYGVGSRVWLQPLRGGPRQEIPVRLELSRPVPPPTLLRGVRVLDLRSGSFSSATSVLLENGRIRGIGKEAGRKLSAGISIVDASGRFAIPGLFDLHVHSAGANEQAFLAYGVTSLRDTGGPLTWLNSMQDRSEFTSNAVPRYFYSGEIFEGQHPYWGDAFLQIDNEQEARNYVRWFKERGAGFIKVYPTLPWHLKRVVADEAHRLGLPIVGHGTSLEEVTRSVNLGFFSLEHTPNPDREYDDALQMLASSGAHWDPTLAVMGADSLLLRDEPEQLSDSKFKAFTPASYIDFALSGGYNKGTSTAALRGVVSARLSAVARAHQLGVPLFIGTDAPNPECFFGSSLHWELARFVEAGLSPLDVLRLATEGAAAAVGTDELGSIAPGKLADLVLLQANPLENIRNTQKIWRVIKGGWVFDPENLKKAAFKPSPSQPELK